MSDSKRRIALQIIDSINVAITAAKRNPSKKSLKSLADTMETAVVALRELIQN